MCIYLFLFILILFKICNNGCKNLQNKVLVEIATELILNSLFYHLLYHLRKITISARVPTIRKSRITTNPVTFIDNIKTLKIVHAHILQHPPFTKPNNFTY